MSRRKVAKKRPVAPDPVYQSRLVSLLVSHLLKKGKKSVAYRIFYEAMTHISETTSQDPLEVLRQAVLNITPKVEVKSRRVGGAVLQVHLKLSLIVEQLLLFVGFLLLHVHVLDVVW